MQSIQTTIDQVVERVKRITPPTWTPRVLVPAVYQIWWQMECRSGLHDDLRPKDEMDLAWIAEYFESRGVLCGAWGIPGFLTHEEGIMHGKAASVVDLYVLDLEPYEDYLEDPTKDPQDFITGFGAYCGKLPDISVVPIPSGIDTLECTWTKWFHFANQFRAQCYWTDNADLHPKVALPYLYKKQREVCNRTKGIIPMYPRPELDPPEVSRLLKIARSPRDIWVLGE